MSINHTKPLSAIALKQLILKSEKGAFKPIGTFEEFKKEVMMIWKNSKSKKYSLLIVTLFALNSCQNNDAIFLKELKQQNVFLEEQMIQANNLLSIKAMVAPWPKKYMTMFFKQDSVMKNFINSLKKTDQHHVDINYDVFIKQSNQFFDSVNKSGVKFIISDIPELELKKDTLIQFIKNDSIKIELIKQQVFQRYLIISQLWSSTSSSCYAWANYRNRNKPEYRLVIEKNTTNYILSLKSYDLIKPPYFDKLEYLSLSKNNKEDYESEDILTDIKSQVIKFKYENDGLIINTKALVKGNYKLYCNKLSISDNGRLIKENAEIDFEIN